MKVKIGNYPNRLICQIYTRYMEKKYGYIDWPKEQTRFENFLEKLEDVIQSVYNLINVLLLDKCEQKVKVHIDPWDTWSMDYTLASIILPMLHQLKETQHGAPFVDNEDVPEELHMPDGWYEEKYSRNGETDPHFFDRWDWVLDEMIYAFDCKANKDDVFMRYNVNEQVKEQERISNGFRLFGKYYESLWD